MKQSANSLALKIAQILEEYTREEIDSALKILSHYGRGEALFQYLASGRDSRQSPRGKTRQARPRSEAKPIEESVSRAVLNLKSGEKEKFRVLSEFDKLVRSGKVLRSNLALRQFGANVSKDFRPGRSRRESIGAVMAVLADRSFEDISQLVDQAISSENVTTEGDFHRLARFLIRGR